ncbi:MAG: anti-sigma factor antagonist [Solirubrobacteraceae bacterium]|nr:anti-sigma factor antagonist [Solirubrobacteraceae bacterium]
MCRWRASRMRARGAGIDPWGAMNQQSMTIRAYEEPSRYVLELGGELDMAGVPPFEAAATRLCELGAREMLVDISDVSFIDSTGIRAILAIKATCERHSCEFTMTHAGEQGDRVFELTRLLDHLPFRNRRPARFRRELDLWRGSAGASGQASA